MTPTSHELRTWDREIVWHAFTQMREYEPFIIDRAQGCTLFDLEGREYIDGISSVWCNVHGHRHPRLDEALCNQLNKVAHVTSLGMSNPTSICLAKRLVDLAPDGLNHVFFSDDGTTCVEVALKMAFQYWRQCDHPRPEKTKYISFDNAYHGDTLGSVSVGGVARFHEMFRPLLFDVVRLPAPIEFRKPDDVPEGELCGYYLRQLEQTLEEQHEQIAALVIEPLVQGAAGMRVHPPGYLRGLRDLTKKFDVLMIADEVAVGMGRTGKMFACEHEQVAPDFLCLAKGITGGYLPLAATLTTDHVWNAFLGSYVDSKSFFHGHTYGGNPLGAAVALASLDVFEEEHTLENLNAKIARLQQHLERLNKLPHVGNVRQRGFMAGVELVENKATGEPFPWTQQRGSQVCRHALEKGVWLRPLGDVIVIMPPLSIELDQLDCVADAVEHGILAATTP
ncbi:MAG: adenosylmethionine--8-amino-7-oxononanoate transaminase [Pirellulaceae bacterium]|nr:adenosylmethionine--8-amino-7-oxononanoate transaminase [Pirellulaceae bacterium]